MRLLPLLALLLLAGCQGVAALASKLPQTTVEPAYEDLAGRSVAVVVWAEPAVELDFPALAQQVGQGVESNLKLARDSGGTRARRALEDVTFPYPSEAFVGYFKEDPTLAGVPTAELAPLLGAERVVYVEIDGFTVHGGAAQGLVRGVAELSLTVYEVDDPVTTEAQASLAQRLDGGPSAARRGYEEGLITVTYPEAGPEEGSSRIPPAAAYQGLVREIGRAVGRRFVPHTEGT